MLASTDPSTRYALAADAPWVRNLSALWASDPQLAAAIESLEGQASYVVEPSKAGSPTVALTTPGGQRIYLHSRHQPIDEARRLVNAAGVDGKAILCLHGLGLGYHARELFETAGDEALILILEPDLLLMRTALEHVDLSPLLASRRVMFFTRPDKAQLYHRLTPHTALLSVGFSFIAHPPSLQFHADFHRQMQTWLAEFAAYSRTNLNTLVLNAQRTCQNIARNAGWYVAAPGLARLEGRYRGHPAIVVSAGPSLAKNKHLLRGASERAVLIAVQTTLQPLLDLGIEPHFVTSLDYHDICTRFFEKLPPTLRTELVAEPKATSAIFSLHPGSVSLCGNELAEKLLAELKPDKLRIRSGATVAHLAYYLAELLGCDPIIFVGQDLGFSDALCYAPGTSYDDVWRPELSRFCTVESKQWEQIVRERPILRKVPDYRGRPMYTEERLFAYLQQFERDFASTSTRIIDATEGGALKRGAAVMPLAEALEKFCARPLRHVAADHPGYRWDLLDAAAGCLENRRDEAGQIAAIADQTMPLLEEIRDHLEDQGRVNRAIARVDALRARMHGLSNCYELVLQTTQRSELQRFHRDWGIASAKLSALERQKRQVERDVQNVRAVAEAAREFAGLMESCAALARQMACQRAAQKAA